MTLHNELITIKDGLTAEIAATDEQISEVQATLPRLEATLSALSLERAEKQQELTQAEATLADLTQSYSTLHARHQRVVGTSIEARSARTLAAMEVRRQEAVTAVKSLQKAVARLGDTTEHTKALADARTRLAELEAHRAELAANYAHFDEQHAAAVKKEVLATLQIADDTIAQLEMELQAAHEARRRSQEQIAAALSPWPDVAREALLAVGRFDTHPGAQILTLKRQLVVLLEQGQAGDPALEQAARVLSKPIPVQEICNYGGRPHLAYLRERGSQMLPHGLVLLEQDMDELERILDDIEQSHREAQVHVLLQRAATPQKQ